ncbi:uncharacterized protein LOC131931746 [Physella acuta]|uniref:uncharacterized protein LOC131931746 n=1 Tax=Physella acuta TaxID=109671 RepID=UPI0027DB1F68|nr:uncharacterized protein LOC131931746 [Physella acuta]
MAAEIFFLSLLLASGQVSSQLTHDCQYEEGSEPNTEDQSCETFWECGDYEGTLRRCPSNTQFDFIRTECRPNREIWCHWQFQRAQERGWQRQEFRPQIQSNIPIHKHWLQERVNREFQDAITYTGERPVSSFTHTHDGSTHVHYLDANGNFIDTTDHFHRLRKPRDTEHVLLAQNQGLNLSPDSLIQTFMELLNDDDPSNFHEREYNSRSRKLGIDYDVMSLKQKDDRMGVSQSKNRAENDGKDEEETEEEDSRKFGHRCRVKRGREMNARDPLCRRFWECEHNMGVEMECDEGYLFDVSAQECLPQARVNCLRQHHRVKVTEPKSSSEKKDQGLTVVHHFYHGGAKPGPDVQPGAIFDVNGVLLRKPGPHEMVNLEDIIMSSRRPGSIHSQDMVLSPASAQTRFDPAKSLSSTHNALHQGKTTDTIRQGKTTDTIRKRSLATKPTATKTPDVIPKPSIGNSTITPESSQRTDGFFTITTQGGVIPLNTEQNQNPSLGELLQPGRDLNNQ